MSVESAAAPAERSPVVAPLEAILCTAKLTQRPKRLPDHEAENRAIAALVQALADAPATILQKLAETLLTVFKADSAGLSLLSPDGNSFYWPAIAGAWRRHAAWFRPVWRRARLQQAAALYSLGVALPLSGGSDPTGRGRLARAVLR